MQPKVPMDRDPLSLAEAAKLADFARVKKKAKLYGCLALVNLVAFSLVLKGMPLHALWPKLGPALGISLACVSATAGHYFVMYLTDLYDGQSKH